MGKLRPRTKSLFLDTTREKEKLHEEYEEQAEQETDEEFTNSEEIDVGDKEKLFRIFDSVLKALPDSDVLTHKQRLARMKWAKVECEDLSPFVVKQKMTSLLNGIRKHRNLKEMLEEALATLTVDDLPDLPDVPDVPQSSKGKRRSGMTNGFIVYMKENKPRFVMQHPNLAHSEITKLVACEYRSLPKKEEEKYKEKARKINSELLGEAAPSSSKKKKNSADEKDLLKFKFIKKETVEAEYPEPRKPYDIFAHRMLLRDPSKSQAELKKQWKALSGQEKAKFILKALKLSKDSDKSVISKEEQKILNEYEGRPNHPGTPFSEFLGENKHCTMTKIVEMWQNLPEDEKKFRMDRNREKLRNYRSKMAEFLESLPEERLELEMSEKKKKSKTAKTAKKDESMDTSRSKKKKKKESKKTFQMVKVEPEASTSSGSSRKKKNEKKQTVPESPEILPKVEVESPKRKRRATDDSDDLFENKKPKLSPKKSKTPKDEECVASSSMTNGEPKSKRSKSKKKSKESNGEVEVKPKKLEPPVQPVG